MPIKLYDFVNTNGTNEFKDWTRTLQSSERGKLNQRLDKLEQVGVAMRPVMLTGTGIGGLEKLRIKGNTQLRPLVTDGPINYGKEFTLLFGAREKGNNWIPANACQQALSRKAAIIEDTDRRVEHVRVK